MTKLVLCRKRRERILIGNEIAVTVLEAERGKAKLLIDAPSEVTVDREEVRRRKQMKDEPSAE